MTGTVISFPAIRFSPADLDMFDEIAEPRVSRGIWEKPRRRASPQDDTLDVHFPHLGKPVFRFMRDQKGYNLLMNDRQGWRPIGSGTTATEALAIWNIKNLKRTSVEN